MFLTKNPNKTTWLHSNELQSYWATAKFPEELRTLPKLPTIKYSHI